jgi:hypothetical protein
VPVLHRYCDKPGMYIRTRQGTAMVTYQLTSTAVAEFQKQGMGEGSRISPETLRQLVASGNAYTHGSGPGEADDDWTSTSDDVSISVNITVRVSVGAPNSPTRTSTRTQPPLSPKQVPAQNQLPAGTKQVTPVRCVICNSSDAIAERPTGLWCGRCWVMINTSGYPITASRTFVHVLEPSSSVQCHSTNEPIQPSTTGVAQSTGRSHEGATSIGPNSPVSATRVDPPSGRTKSDNLRAANGLWSILTWNPGGVNIWLWLLVLAGIVIPIILVYDASTRH